MSNTNRDLEYIVLASPRSGSTLLCELFEKNGIMNSSQQGFHYEPLSPVALKKEQISPLQFTNLVEEKVNDYTLRYPHGKEEILVSGFKLLTFHFKNLKHKYAESITSLLNTLTKNKKVILVLRHNYEEQKKSFILAMHANGWGSYKGSFPNKQKNVFIPKGRYEELSNLFDTSYDLYHKTILKELVAHPSVLTIYYEGLINSTEETLDQVWSFLNLEKPNQWLTQTLNQKQSMKISNSPYSYALFLLGKVFRTLKTKLEGFFSKK